MNIIRTAYKYLDGRNAWEVPVIHRHNGSSEPRCPVGGWTAFYTRDSNRCVVVPDKTAEKYLRKRRYARFVGTMLYDLNGINHSTRPLTAAMLNRERPE